MREISSGETPLVNQRVKKIRSSLTPRHQKGLTPIDPAAALTVAAGRRLIEGILEGRGSRFMVIVGPCSIHDIDGGLEYATRLRELAIIYQDSLLIVMRTYFEKPRTTFGWKGLLNEPDRDGDCNVDRGRRLAREFLLALAHLGLPAATEFLDPNTPQFLDDLVSWAAIGARTVESQTHREMAAGLSMPVGFKNGTGGSIDIAVNAMLAARHPHTFVGIDEDGRECVFAAEGNPHGHLILRGGSTGPNYSHADVTRARALLQAKELPGRILIDCSHANASGDYRNQKKVLETILLERSLHEGAIVGVMLESNLIAGNQNAYGSDIVLGQSVTDGCLGWEETAEILAYIHDKCKT